MNTNDGSSILAEGNRNYSTSDFDDSSFEQNENEITIEIITGRTGKFDIIYTTLKGEDLVFPIKIKSL